MRIEFVRVTFRTKAPVFVSAPETVAYRRSAGAPTTDVDLPLRRDLHGAPVVPATGVAGSLREHLPEGLRSQLMGFVSADESSRSVLWVLGTEVRPPDRGKSVTAFHRTAIDAWSGAAASGKLFDGEGLATGSRLVVRMALMGANPEEKSALMQALTTWSPRLGRGTSTGAGRVSTEAIESASLDLSVPQDLLLYLNSGGPEQVDAVIDSRGSSVSPKAAEADFLLNEPMEIADALHVGDTKPATGNTQELLRDACGNPMIPGTTLKGILRSRVEYILRSLGVHICPDGADPECPSCHLFGYTLPSPDAGGRTGRRSRLAVHDAPLSGAVLAVRDHVAIDRVTGGARDQALFATEVVTEGTFRFQVEMLEPVPEWAQGLLWAALADIDEGFVGIGGGTTRGQGTVRRVGGSLREEHASEIQEALDALAGSDQA